MSTTKEIQTRMTPSEALEQLKAGNERFLTGKMLSRDYNRELIETADGQFPFAAILGCIDSRATTEKLFDQGVGDLESALRHDGIARLTRTAILLRNCHATEGATNRTLNP